MPFTDFNQCTERKRSINTVFHKTKSKYLWRGIVTVESRFLEPSRETEFDSRNREFEKSKVAANVAKFSAGVLFYKGQSCIFSYLKDGRWQIYPLLCNKNTKGDGRFAPCCVIKIQNELKYNFSGWVSLLQVATVIHCN